MNVCVCGRLLLFRFVLPERASTFSVQTYAALVRNTTPHPSGNSISSFTILG